MSKYKVDFAKQLINTVDCDDLSKRIEKDLENLKDLISSEILYFIDRCIDELLDGYEPCPIRTESLKILFKGFQELTNEGLDQFEQPFGVIEELHND